MLVESRGNVEGAPVADTGKQNREIDVREGERASAGGPSWTHALKAGSQGTLHRQHCGTKALAWS